MPARRPGSRRVGEKRSPRRDARRTPRIGVLKQRRGGGWAWRFIPPRRIVPTAGLFNVVGRSVTVERGFKAARRRDAAEHFDIVRLQPAQRVPDYLGVRAI